MKKNLTIINKHNSLNQSVNVQKLNTLLLGTALGFLIFITLINKTPIIYDEVLFVPNVVLMEEVGFGKEFLLKMEKQAPGPLYQLIHLTLKPLTKLQPPGIRIVNLVFLILIIIVMARVVKNAFSDQGEKYDLMALEIMAFPVIWLIAGMALSEIPAMFFVSLSLLMLSYIFKNKYSFRKNALFSLLAGIFMGLASLGRTPYLALIFPLLLLALYKDFRTFKKLAAIIIPFFLTPLLIMMPVFLVWGGLTSPNQPVISFGLSLWHGILGFAYGSVITLLIAPRWFVFNKKILIALSIGFIVLFIYFTWFTNQTYYPLSVTVERYFPGFIVRFYKLMISPILACLGLYYIICALKHLYDFRDKLLYAFSILSALLIMLSTIANSYQFSSRYVAQAIPFMLIAMIPFIKISWQKLIFTCIAMAIGIMSLNTYVKIF